MQQQKMQKYTLMIDSTNIDLKKNMQKYGKYVNMKFICKICSNFNLHSARHFQVHQQSPLCILCIFFAYWKMIYINCIFDIFFAYCAYRFAYYAYLIAYFVHILCLFICIFVAYFSAYYASFSGNHQ